MGDQPAGHFSADIYFVQAGNIFGIQAKKYFSRRGDPFIFTGYPLRYALDSFYLIAGYPV